MSMQNVRRPQQRALLAFLALLVALSGAHQRFQSGLERRHAQEQWQTQRRLQDLAAQGLDLNRASQKELERLPGIGPQLAQRIISCRREFGDFIRPRDLWKIPGFGDNRLSQLRVFIRTNPK